MSTPYGCPSTITPADNQQYPNLITSYEDSLFSELPLLIITYIQPVPPPPTKDTNTEPSDKTLHKNSSEPLSILTLLFVQKDKTNLPPVPPSSTPSPCQNRKN